MIYRQWTCAKIEAGSQCVPAKDILVLSAVPLQVDPEEPWPCTIHQLQPSLKLLGEMGEIICSMKGPVLNIP